MMTGITQKTLQNHIQAGNSKLPKTTAIFNLGAAHDCPSAALGLCEVSDICYAKGAEVQYHKSCPQYRRRQTDIWNSITAADFAEFFININGRKRAKFTALRINESGDFWGQSCVDKLEEIASILADHGVIVYGYTARKDLDFTGLTHAKIRGSNHHLPGQFGTFKAVDKPSGDAPVCPGDCKVCNLCSIYDGTVEVVKH